MKPGRGAGPSSRKGSRITTAQKERRVQAGSRLRSSSGRIGPDQARSASPASSISAARSVLPAVTMRSSIPCRAKLPRASAR